MKNYLKHSRPKGSRNGYTTMKNYKPVGTPAKGKLINGRYVYEEGLKNGNLPSLPKDFTLGSAGYHDIRKEMKNNQQTTQATLKPATESNTRVIKENPGQKFLNETFAKERKTAAIAGKVASKVAKQAQKWFSDYKNDMKDAFTYTDEERAKDAANAKAEEEEAARTWKRRINSPEYKAQKENEENKKKFIEEREREYKKSRNQNASKNQKGNAFVQFLINGTKIGRLASQAANYGSYQSDLSKERDAWEHGYDSYEDMQKGKRSKNYTGW